MKIKCKGINCKKFFQKRIHKFPSYIRDEKNKFCSSACALSVVRTRKHQIKAGKKGALANIVKYRGTGYKTYVKENGRHQHRVVMERILGRKLKKGEIVHHKDHNKKNNDPKNLEVMTQAIHAGLHIKKLKRNKLGQLQKA